MGAVAGGGEAAHPHVGFRFLTASSDDQEDLAILAEVAERASAFISSVAPTLRNDIRSGIHHSDDEGNEENEEVHLSRIVQNEIVENLVASWTFSASKCILEAISASPLSARLDPLLRQLNSSIRPASEDDKTPLGLITNSVHRKGLPERTSSLKAHASVVSQRPGQESFPSVTSLDAVRLLPPATSHPGTQELASQRGDLLSLARRALSGLGWQHLNRRGGLADVDLVFGANKGEMQEVNLEDPPESRDMPLESSAIQTRASTHAGLCNKALISALQSENGFYRAYEVRQAFNEVF